MAYLRCVENCCNHFLCRYVTESRALFALADLGNALRIGRKPTGTNGATVPTNAGRSAPVGSRVVAGSNNQRQMSAEKTEEEVEKRTKVLTFGAQFTAMAVWDGTGGTASMITCTT